ncbi:YbhB/YbcL family Raf kinase inhibitor-like protein [Sulfurimonas marina]|uniref:YbhB/YbcL family Raf kinase inhibitor-like protein n=1 Tax=Sulfurimonas marina TaxID=2590551 RepID=A0A7M1AX98_9BACT|nr:YbhB/YbcL family Raf kinase inhibitor-like protein [Sulfurimonas marina]QOP42073.1 YbhB/YbcL family Raf kinase inhibitor-like protein [Sulfurimonas marina]
MKKIILMLLVSVSMAFAEGFTLNSDEFSGQLGNAQVFNGFGCTGKNISPSLNWENAPKGTKSFAIMMYDKDAPTGSGWWHWIVVDIPKDVTTLKQNSGNVALDLMPKGALQTKTDYGVSGFGGACPPVGHGSHQYVITLYALDVDTLGVKADASPALVGYMVNAHTIAKASVVAYFSR